jgi:radical SAM protein with 4Fe4S-binding SPASM domain
MLQKLRYAKYRYKYLNAPKLNLDRPVDVSLELSSYCTNKCGYCYHSASVLPFKKGFMPLEMAKSVIDQASELGVNSLKWNYRGEATMNKNFREITAYAKSLASGSTFIDRIINSNFNFRNDNGDVFQGLLNQTKVKVSFDSFRKDIFEKQRKGSRFEETIANIKKLHDWPNRKTKLVIQSVRTKLNQDEDLEYEIKSRFPDAAVSIRDVVGGRVDKDLSDVVVKTRDLDNRKSCIQAHARIIVNWDGNVTVCCPDIASKLVIGNVKESSVYDIWNSDKAKEIRKSLLDKSAFTKEPCKSCPSYESYFGFKPSLDS